MAYRLVTSISSVTSSATWRAKPNRPLSEPSTPGEISVWTDFPVGQWKEKYHFWKYGTLPTRKRQGNRYIDKIPWKNTIRTNIWFLRWTFWKSWTMAHILSLQAHLFSWRQDWKSLTEGVTVKLFSNVEHLSYEPTLVQSPSTSWFQWPFPGASAWIQRKTLGNFSWSVSTKKTKKSLLSPYLNLQCSQCLKNHEVVDQKLREEKTFLLFFSHPNSTLNSKIAGLYFEHLGP